MLTCPIYNSSLKTLSLQVWTWYQCVCFFKLLIFICGFSAKGTKIYTFPSEKNAAASQFLIRFRFQEYPCKSTITICAWRVTWNYSYTVPLRSTTRRVGDPHPLYLLAKSLHFCMLSKDTTKVEIVNVDLRILE